MKALGKHLPTFKACSKIPRFQEVSHQRLNSHHVPGCWDELTAFWNSLKLFLHGLYLWHFLDFILPSFHCLKELLRFIDGKMEFEEGYWYESCAVRMNYSKSRTYKQPCQIQQQVSQFRSTRSFTRAVVLAHERAEEHVQAGSIAFQNSNLPMLWALCRLDCICVWTSQSKFLPLFLL